MMLASLLITACALVLCKEIFELSTGTGGALDWKSLALSTALAAAAAATADSIPQKLRAYAHLGALAIVLICMLPVFPILWPCLRWRRRTLLHGPNGGSQRRVEGTPPGKLIRLSYGATHYRCDGGEEPSGAITVLVHGNVGSMRYLDELADSLAGAQPS